MGALHKLESKWNADKHAAYGQLDLPLNYVVNRIEGGEVCLLCATSMSEWGFTPIERLRIADCQRELEEVISAAAGKDTFLRINPPRIIYHGFLSWGYVLPRNTNAEQVLRDANYQINQMELANPISPVLNQARFIGLSPRWRMDRRVRISTDLTNG